MLQRGAESRGILKLTKAIIDPLLSPEQQVWALRKASRCPKVLVHFGGAESPVDNALLYYLLKNIKTILHLATRITKTKGYPTDDMRSLVQTIILAIQPSLTAPKSSLVDKVLAYKAYP